ncbi:hypothetical protein ACTMTI_56265 [Nonomuraea sp. H19]|jgi:hypothetical protein|uniref:hypothetical protein n=1 Tax=Nonomuraea sp. H19 TaxID=3452206 RepID=UPI003F88D212
MKVSMVAPASWWAMASAALVSLVICSTSAWQHSTPRRWSAVRPGWRPAAALPGAQLVDGGGLGEHRLHPRHRGVV